MPIPFQEEEKKLIVKEINTAEQTDEKPNGVGSMKWLSLAIMIVQNSSLALTMRYTRRKAPGERLYITTTAVFLAECLKLLSSCALMFCLDCDLNFQAFKDLLYKEFVSGKVEFLKLFIPAGLYALQNNLSYIAASNLAADVCQILSNLKIITTAIFSVLLLHTSLNGFQWSAIFMLALGICMVHASQAHESNTDAYHNTTVGLLALLSSACISGFVGVYFEMILKKTKCSIWVRNFQLSLISIGFSGTICYINDFHYIMSYGFFVGYDSNVWITIALAALGGLIVASVLKYADNVLKGFAISLAVVLTSFVSIVVFDDTKMTPLFIIGSVIVIGSSFLYPLDQGQLIGKIRETMLKFPQKN